MRSKTLGINVRVTPDEKEKLLKNADYCATFSFRISAEAGAWNEMLKQQFEKKIYRTFPAVKATESSHSAVT